MVRGERAVELRSPFAGPSLASLGWPEQRERPTPKSRRREQRASPRALERKRAPAATLGALSYSMHFGPYAVGCEAHYQLSVALPVNSEPVGNGAHPRRLERIFAFSDAAFHTLLPSLCSLDVAADSYRRLTSTVSNDFKQSPRSIRWFNDVSCPRLWLLSRIQRCRPPPSVSPRTVRQRAIT